MKRLIFLAVCLLAAPALAQKAPEPTSDAMEAGVAAGRIAGKADYCRAAQDSLEDYITLAHARIAIKAKDKLDQILGELEFSNYFSISKTREPPEGCDEVLKAFPAEIDRLK